MIMAIVIESLHSVSVDSQGIADVGDTSALYYLWTFGPTAVFAVIAALWARVDFQANRNMPWIILARGQDASASETLLLDYASDFSLMEPLRAFKRRHYLVAVVSSIGIVMRVLVPVSTGLLSPQQVTVRQDGVPIVVRDKVRFFDHL